MNVLNVVNVNESNERWCKGDCETNKNEKGKKSEADGGKRENVRKRMGSKDIRNVGRCARMKRGNVVWCLR